MNGEQPIDVALRVAAVLESLGLAYHLGGSLASSIHGEPRATNDIDFVVDLRRESLQAVVDALGNDFAIDRASLLDAVRDRASCNIFYLPAFTKIDLFVVGVDRTANQISASTINTDAAPAARRPLTASAWAARRGRDVPSPVVRTRGAVPQGKRALRAGSTQRGAVEHHRDDLVARW